ncbi:uncharacterized protein NPIL_554651 [Nephila pilipes]|uniref:Uncharacterized protein n=1 Tax=Nephila pilipes TaxID=299642 RepID=A0A8X6UK40_NEPPI|nr:uncharacterized protein NPIL_554651 [Nephila pilipes]
MEDSDESIFYSITSKAFFIILTVFSVDYWLICLSQYQNLMNKSSIFLNAQLPVMGAWIAMMRKRKHLSLLLIKIGEISTPQHSVKFNIFSILLFIFPSAFTFSLDMIYFEKHAVRNIFTYGYYIGNPTAQAVLTIIKRMLYLFIHPSFTQLMALLYCLLCQRCTDSINHLTEEILRFRPEEFTPQKQIKVLKRKARIDDILDTIQDVFSLTSFLLITASLMACINVVGRFLHVRWNGNFNPYETTLQAICFFGIITSILWVAGGVTISGNRFKEAFYKKAHIRLIFGQEKEETRLQRGLFEAPDLELTGCGLISYKRSTLLGIIGTLITYTIVVVGLFKSC